MKPLEGLFWEEIAEMIHAENLLLKWIPKMRQAASEKLKACFDEYLQDSQIQSERAIQMLVSFKSSSREKKNEAMMGLLLRAQQFIQRTGPGPALDAALISLARRITSYTTTCYENLVSWAEVLAQKETAQALEEMVASEKESGKRFKAIQQKCNAEAAQQMVDSPRAKSHATKRAKEPIERWGEW